MSKRAILILAATLATLGAAMSLPTIASAQTAGAFMANPAFKDPRPKSCDSTFDMQHCAAADLRRADAQMAMAYKDAVSASADPGSAKALLAAQRSWLTFRDQECPWRGSLSGGAMSSVVVAQCWVEVTKARREQLKAAIQP